MKRIFKLLGITGIATMLAITAPVTKSVAQVYDDDQYIDYNNDYNGSYQDFYNSLSPYGQWIQDPQYGYVWLPDAGSDFRPYYTNGRWVMTEYGNTWVSDYPWGWAPFHYGRWTFSSYYGWVWIPGSQWGPAWVSWRSSNDYYGWAPLGPGISVSVSFGAGYSCPMDWWVFIPGTYIYNPRFQSYYRGPRYNQTYINRTTIINNTYINNSSHTTYVVGPRANDIQRITRQPVHVYKVENMNRIGTSTVGGNALSIYRPQIRSAANSGGGLRPRPQQIVKSTQSIGHPEAVSSSNGTPPGRTQVFNSRANGHFMPQGSNTRPAQTAPGGNNWQQQQTNRPMQQQQPQQSQPQRNNWQSQPAQQPVRQQSQPVQQQQPQRGNWQQTEPVQQQQPQPQRNNWQQTRPAQPVQQQPAQQPQRSNWQQSQPAQPVRQQAPQPERSNWQQPRPQPAPQQQPQPVRQAPPPHMEAPRPQPAPQPQRENPMRR